MSFGNLINFYCEDIEEKHGIPYDVTYDFFKGRKVPYAFVKIYQEYFSTPWFSKLLDEFQLKSYHIGAEKGDNLQENEYIAMDDSFLDVGIESGDIFAVSPGEYTSYFQAIEFNGYVMPAYIISSDKKETVIEFDHEDFEPVVLPTNRIKFLGSIECYREADSFNYKEVVLCY